MTSGKIICHIVTLEATKLRQISSIEKKKGNNILKKLLKIDLFIPTLVPRISFSFF